MGVDLLGHGGASFTWDSWRKCLDIAIVLDGNRPVLLRLPITMAIGTEAISQTTFKKSLI